MLVIHYINLSVISYLIFISNAIVLSYLGACPLEEPYLSLGKLSTQVYFAFFLILPILDYIERTCVSKFLIAKKDDYEQPRKGSYERPRRHSKKKPKISLENELKPCAEIQIINTYTQGDKRFITFNVKKVKKFSDN